MLSEAHSSTASMSSSSTLTETVSIDYEDFSENFLKCSTCLCMYETVAHNPKLLPCSHTVCHVCLERIVAMQGPDCTSFRCPICREVVSVPRGGVTAFPPSFIINQLLDLMARQRRDVVPKCSRHSQSELMFCESCDIVFCIECTSSAHSNKGASAHTIIPFSVAIKRMSEILLYKTGLCIKNLDKASEAVVAEINRLELAANRCIEDAEMAFQDVVTLVDQRRREIGSTISRIREGKMLRLREQLELIDSEKLKVRSSCHGLQQQVEVRNITAKISDLNEKLDMSTTLVEPRENAFMIFESRSADSLSDVVDRQLGTVVTGLTAASLPCSLPSELSRAGDSSATLSRVAQGLSLDRCGQGDNLRMNYGQGSYVTFDPQTQGSSRTGYSMGLASPSLMPLSSLYPATRDSSCSIISVLSRALSKFGCVRVSRTFPALCTVSVSPLTIHLRSTFVVQTVDYDGNPQTVGGDPVRADIKSSKNDKISVTVVDNFNGTYSISFIPVVAGQYFLTVTIFERSVKDCPFSLQVDEHINPVQKLGGTGSGEGEMRQPVSVISAADGTLYVLDTGNSRVKVLDSSGQFLRHVTGPGLDHHSGTGFALHPVSGNLVVVNWRSKTVTELNAQTGDVVRSFGCAEFVEPICVAVNSLGEIIVGDNGLGKLFIFDSMGNKLRTVGGRGDKRGELKLISFVCVTPGDELIVCDHRVQAFSASGSVLYELPPVRPGSAKCQYGGCTVDSRGMYLVTRSEKGRSVVDVYSSARVFLYEIDSHADKLKRPSGLATTSDGHVLVADLGNDCVKKYRYV